MRIRLTILLLLLLAIITSPCKSQQVIADSLVMLASVTQSDTARARLFMQAGWAYINLDSRNALHYAKKAQTLAKSNGSLDLHLDINRLLATCYGYIAEYDSAISIINYSIKQCETHGKIRHLAAFYNNLGMQYDYKSNLDSARICFEKSIYYDTQTGNKKGTSSGMMGLGNIYRAKGDYKKALNYYFQSLRLKEEAKDKAGISELYLSIGNVYYNQELWDEAQGYYEKSLELKKELGDEYGEVSCFTNLAVVASYKGDNAKSLRLLFKTIKIQEKIGDAIWLAQNYSNIGSVYGDLGKNDSSLYYVNKAIEIQTKIGDKEGLITSYLNLFNCYTLQKEPVKGIPILEKAYALAEETKSWDYIAEVAKNLSLAYSESGDFKKAYHFHVIFKSAYDSLNNQENTRHLTQVEMQYDFDKKQKEQQFEQTKKDLETKEEIKRQKLLRNSFLGGFGLMLLLAWVIFRSYRQKRRDNHLLTLQKTEILQKNEELNTQKEEIQAQRDEIEAQRDLVTQQKGKIEHIHSELKSSIQYARRIQEAMLASPNSDSLGISDLFILFQPRDIVSGDFYWINRVNDMLLFSVADCTGHGVPGGFMSMLGIASLNDIVNRDHVTNTDQVLDELRSFVMRSLHQKGISGEQKDGMDIAFCALNLNTLELQFSGANNPCWIMTSENTILQNGISEEIPEENEGLFEIRGDKMPVAIYARMDQYKRTTIQLKKGDQVYLFSDGIVDQYGGPKNEKFKNRRLRELIRKNASLSSGDQLKVIESEINRWKSHFNPDTNLPYHQTDDMCLMGIRI